MAIASINPATGQLIKSFDGLTDAQIEDKIQRAADAFSTYRHIPFAQRARWMNQAAEILEADKHQYAELTRKMPSASWPTKSSRRPRAAAMCAISRWA
jgi:succinate-semialdehyde dehydrogenase/glutarate-semialdehyde dehydrogenase